jgi:uncharacterized protein
MSDVPGHDTPRRPAAAAPAAGESPPDTEHHVVPWTVLDAVGVLAVTVAVSGVLVVAFGFISAAGVLPEALAPVLLPLPLLVLAGTTLAWLRVRAGSVRPLGGPRRLRAREWLVGAGWGVGGFVAVNLALGVALQLAAELVGIELPQPQEQVRDMAADPTLIPWLLLSAVVVAPVAEELYFRGMLYQALRRRMRTAGAVGLSAILFAGAHILQEVTGLAGVVVFVLILPLGVLLGWLFERRGNLAAPIAVHVTFNLVTASIMMAGAVV